MDAALAYSSAYVLITPVHDELSQLHDLVTTVRAQEQRPALWVIVDDHSSDGTTDELRRLSRRIPWIHGIAIPRRPNGVVDPSRRHAEVLCHGFVAARELAEAEGVSFDLVATMDADVRSPPQLLAELIHRLEGDRQVGIASCSVAEVRDDGRVVPQLEAPDRAPRASLRMWRRECLEEVGLSPSAAWASVTALRARNRGWKTIVYSDLAAETVRGDGTRGGWWHGYRRRGHDSWHVGVHPLVVAGQAVAATVHDRDLRGVALVSGYVEAALRGQPRTSDTEIVNYHWDDLRRHQANTLLSRIPVVGRRFRRP